jgi:hypothetical protein
VRRAFALIINNTPPNVKPLKKFLMYFAEVYIGLNDVEKKLGIRAFEPNLIFHHRPPTLANSIGSILNKLVDKNIFFSGPISAKSTHPFRPTIASTINAFHANNISGGNCAATMGNPNFPGLSASICNRILECQRPRNKGNRKNEQQHGGCSSAIPGLYIFDLKI